MGARGGALSLGVQAGSKIKIGKSVLSVLQVLNTGLQVRVFVRGRFYTISDDERVEVLPNVFIFCGVSAGRGWNMPNKSKLAIEAPTDILIDRLGVTP
jgi:hypothetical protein